MKTKSRNDLRVISRPFAACFFPGEQEKARQTRTAAFSSNPCEYEAQSSTFFWNPSYFYLSYWLRQAKSQRLAEQHAGAAGFAYAAGHLPAVVRQRRAHQCGIFLP